MDRRQALIGYVTFLLARRLVRRQLRQRVARLKGAVRPPGGRKGVIALAVVGAGAGAAALATRLIGARRDREE